MAGLCEWGELRLIGRRLGNSWKSGIGGNDENTLLLLHGKDFTDSSSNHYTVTNSGASVVDGGKFEKALYFTGDDYLRIAGMVIGPSAPFTVDAWIKQGATNRSGSIVGGHTDSTLQMRCDVPTGQYWCSSSYKGLFFVSNKNALVNPTTKYSHLAWVYNGTKHIGYINGVAVNSTSPSLPFYNSNGIYIGACGDTGGIIKEYFIGYISELRISNIARWTSNFTPPDQPYS